MLSVVLLFYELNFQRNFLIFFPLQMKHERNLQKTKCNIFSRISTFLS